MGKFYDSIPDFLATWILQQKVFWVASAPLTADGFVNLSPKGVEGSFHIINPNKVWYEDLSGSGIETLAHLRENGRITVMFNAFEGPPRICRLFGKGVAYEFGTPEYEALLPPNKRQIGSRAAIVIDVYKVGTSCGYAVPFFTYKCPRNRLLEFFRPKEVADIEAEAAIEQSGCATPPRPENGLKQYWLVRNAASLDGLPGIVSAQDSMQHFKPTNAVYKKDNEGPENLWQSLIKAADYKTVAAFAAGVLISTTYRHFIRTVMM